MIRPFRDDDISGVTSLWRALRLDAVHSELALRHLIESMPPRAQAMHWIADDGGIVGWAFAHRRWWRASNTAYVWIGVRPEARARGFGRKLWELAADHVASLDVDRVYADTVGDPAGERFLAARDFTPDRTDVISGVDPRSVDLSELGEREARARAEGYRVATYADVDSHALYRLDIETADDMPGGDAPHELTFEEWSAEILNQPDFTQEGSVVVLRASEPVAQCALSVDWGGRRARNEGTGTARAHRRRGLALLAKLVQMRWAAENSIESIITDNDAENIGMLAINERLGYRPFVERRRWIKQLSSKGTVS